MYHMYHSSVQNVLAIFETMPATDSSCSGSGSASSSNDAGSASSSNLPSLYLCRAENMLGCVPMMPCFVSGISTPTLPHQCKNNQGRYQRAGGEATAVLGYY
jgi:hypothetical protein